MTSAADPRAASIERDAAIPTWFKVGGRADRLARPATLAELSWCVEQDAALRVLGDGANLLVYDSGVAELVVSLQQGVFREQSISAEGVLRVGAGVSLMPLIAELVRQGWGGLETVAGVPATIGGAVMMNAGGRFGEIRDRLLRIEVMDRTGRPSVIEKDEIAFGYRRSGLEGWIVTGASFQLEAVDPAPLRARLKEIMAAKKASQPMGANSAGCSFKNPTLARDVEGIGGSGARVSAGLLIDRAGCKGLRVGAASVSEVHANFLVTHEGATARDVLGLMDEVRRRVMDRFGVSLEREVVVWSRAGSAGG